eukprot:TRINITY_DN5410_c0_g1_i1.p1 TRINITY_DN5410_c0_g1~~TRINITY_DN5410_c0_g1_i1.p1  ORF type:complete len:198 (-),score=21.63 TRINITY_DN5410_c0_g1_i1:11-604(-)
MQLRADVACCAFHPRDSGTAAVSLYSGHIMLLRGLDSSAAPIVSEVLVAPPPADLARGADSLAWHADGRRLLVSFHKFALQVLDTAPDRHSTIIADQRDSVFTLKNACWSSEDADEIVAASYLDGVVFYNSDDGGQVWSVHCSHSVWAVCALPLTPWFHTEQCALRDWCIGALRRAAPAERIGVDRLPAHVAAELNT